MRCCERVVPHHAPVAVTDRLRFEEHSFEASLGRVADQAVEADHPCVRSSTTIVELLNGVLADREVVTRRFEELVPRVSPLRFHAARVLSALPRRLRARPKRGLGKHRLSRGS